MKKGKDTEPHLSTFEPCTTMNTHGFLCVLKRREKKGPPEGEEA